MNEFKEQLDKEEKEKVEKLVAELRELSGKGQAGDASLSAETIREKIHETQQASLGLFKKVCCSVHAHATSVVDQSLQVYEKRSAENSSSEAPPSEEKKD
jgi:molecular chaperone DnaK